MKFANISENKVLGNNSELTARGNWKDDRLSCGILTSLLMFLCDVWRPFKGDIVVNVITSAVDQKI